MEKTHYVYKVSSVVKVIDGDTIEAIIDLGFNILLRKKIRLSEINSAELRSNNLTEKTLALQAKEWLTKKLEGQNNILIHTEKPDSTEKYGRILAKLYVNGECINDLMIKEGYASLYKNN
jgi:micrococcal nuclease